MSAVVRLVPHQKPPVNVFLPALQKVVLAAFGQRRKTLRNSLGGLLGPEMLAELSIDARLRAQDLALEDFARIAAALPVAENC
jgi:16S rRNA (adenine1518-N6/adenine1519-N6)-dimethyltransferase